MLDKGIHHRLSTVYTPQQMGVAEKSNQDLLTKVRCMLIESGLGPSFWGEALYTACYVKNRCVSSVTGKTPYELWNGKEIPERELRSMRVFGCIVFAATRPKSKLTKRGKLCVMLGYSSNRCAYRLYEIEGKYVIESRM